MIKGSDIMTNYEKIINSNVDELSKFFSHQLTCEICVYQGEQECKSLSHKKESCIIGIKRFLEKECEEG